MLKQLLTVSAALLLLACGPAATTSQQAPADSEQPRSGGTMNFRVPQDPYDWDMSYLGKNGSGSQEAEGYPLAYEGLLAFKTGPDVPYLESVLTPQLAETWDVAPDGKTFTFRLRKGVRFANLQPVNGREFTSEDVRWSFEYWARTGPFASMPKGPFAYMLEGLQQVDTPDASTAVVRFNEPFVPFLTYTASQYIPVVPHEIVDQDGHLKDRIVGTGPYQLQTASSQKGSRWVWAKNPDYRTPGRPYIDELRWLLISSDSAGTAAFQTKQLDYLSLERISLDGLEQVKRAAPNAIVGEYEFLNSMYVFINTGIVPLNDIRVRKAIALSLDRDEFINTFQGGKGRWEMPHTFNGYFSQEEIRRLAPYDPAQARQLLAQAGHPNGVEFEMTINPNYGDSHISMVQLFQAQLKKTGINLILKPIDPEAYSANRKKRPPQFTINFTPAGASGRFDPDSVVAYLHPKSATNYYQVNDPKLTALVEAQRREPDEAKRREIFRNIGQLVVENAHSLGWYSALEYGVRHPHVKNFHRTVNGPHFPIREVWLDK